MKQFELVIVHLLVLNFERFDAVNQLSTILLFNCRSQAALLCVESLEDPVVRVLLLSEFSLKHLRLRVEKPLHIIKDSTGPFFVDTCTKLIEFVLVHLAPVHSMQGRVKGFQTILEPLQ